MRVLVNGRFLTQQPAGVHRYAFEICRALVAQGVDILVLAPRGTLYQRELPFPVERVGRTASHLWEQVELPLYVRRHHRGALLVNFAGLSPILYNNCVTTIHDLSFLENPQWFSRGYRWWYRLMTPLSARRARRIITVSDFSKGEIVKHLSIAPEKILVAYNAVADDMAVGQPPEANDYVLAVSSIDPRKNLSRLLEAFRQMGRRDVQLIVVGARNKVFAEVDGLESTDSRIRFVGYLDSEALAACYAHAKLFVYPSLYEGFGIPVLEAMHFGCPVLLSDIPPFHEVAGDSALYCDPLDVASIARQMERMLNDDTLCRRFVEQGRARCKQFSWSSSATKIYELLRALE